MDKIELLSPAGDLERLKVTLLYGADAVYIGGEIGSLRANAINFTIPEIKEGKFIVLNLFIMLFYYVLIMRINLNLLLF